MSMLELIVEGDPPWIGQVLELAGIDHVVESVEADGPWRIQGGILMAVQYRVTLRLATYDEMVENEIRGRWEPSTDPSVWQRLQRLFQ